MVEPWFTCEHVEGMRPTIEAIVEDVLNDMIKGGCEKPVDLIDKFALPIPTMVTISLALLSHVEEEDTLGSNIQPSQIIYRILGVPLTDMTYLSQQAAVRGSASSAAAEASAANQCVQRPLPKTTSTAATAPHQKELTYDVSDIR